MFIDGFRFGPQVIKGLKTRWRCSGHYRHRCRASVITIMNQIVLQNGIHNHLRPKKRDKGSPRSKKRKLKTEDIAATADTDDETKLSLIDL